MKEILEKINKLRISCANCLDNESCYLNYQEAINLLDEIEKNIQKQIEENKYLKEKCQNLERIEVDKLECECKNSNNRLLADTYTIVKQMKLHQELNEIDKKILDTKKEKEQLEERIIYLTLDRQSIERNYYSNY